MRQRRAALRVVLAFGHFFCFFSPFPSESFTMSSTFTLACCVSTTSTYSIAVTRRHSYVIPGRPELSRPCNRDVAFPARKPLHLPKYCRHRQPHQSVAIFVSLVPLRVVSLLNKPIGERIDPRREAYYLPILAPSSSIFLKLFIEQLLDFTSTPGLRLPRWRSGHTNMIYPRHM